LAGSSITWKEGGIKQSRILRGRFEDRAHEDGIYNKNVKAKSQKYKYYLERLSSRDQNGFRRAKFAKERIAARKPEGD